MKTIGTMLGAVGCIAFLLGTSAASAHSPVGQSYKVSVFSNFGTQFTSCFSFDKTGNVTVEGYGPLVYRRDQLNAQADKWQATPSSTPLPSGFILSFHGNVGGVWGQTIAGDGVNEFGDTFIFQGVVVYSCPARAATGATSPFRK